MPIPGGKYVSKEDALANLTRSSLDGRIAQARQNLGIGSIFGLLGVLGQNPNENIPAYDDRFLDSRVREIPQHIKDQQSYDIDRTLRSTTNNVLASVNLNRAANIIAAANANALNAKSRVAAQNATQDIALKNQYYDLKNASLQRYNKSVADKLNAIRNNKNAQIQGVAGIGTNFFNELQKSISKVNAIGDQQALTSNSLNQLLPIMNTLKIR